MMSAIRSRDTKPEITVRKFLHGQGFRYRLNHKELPGKPDLVLRRRNAVVLVHGCYWHGHSNCQYATESATRREYWRQKIAANKERDARVIGELNALGWRTAVIWECALRKESQVALSKLERFLLSNEPAVDIAWRV